MDKRFQNFGIRFCSDFEHKPIPASHPGPVCLAGGGPWKPRVSDCRIVARQFYCSAVEIELLLQTVWISTNWLSLMENALLEDFQPILLILQGKNINWNKRKCFNSDEQKLHESIWFHDSTSAQAFLKIHKHKQKNVAHWLPWAVVKIFLNE